MDKIENKIFFGLGDITSTLFWRLVWVCWTDDSSCQAEISGSSRNCLWAGRPKKSKSRSHPWQAKSARSCSISMNSVPSIHGILVNYSDFICWPNVVQNKTKYSSFYIISNCLPAYDWFSEVLTRKPQSKQTTTALDQESCFFSTTVLRVLTNFEEFILRCSLCSKQRSRLTMVLFLGQRVDARPSDLIK